MEDPLNAGDEFKKDAMDIDKPAFAVKNMRELQPHLLDWAQQYEQTLKLEFLDRGILKSRKPQLGFDFQKEPLALFDTVERKSSAPFAALNAKRMYEVERDLDRVENGKSTPRATENGRTLYLMGANYERHAYVFGISKTVKIGYDQNYDCLTAYWKTTPDYTPSSLPSVVTDKPDRALAGAICSTDIAASPARCNALLCGAFTIASELATCLRGEGNVGIIVQHDMLPSFLVLQIAISLILKASPVAAALYLRFKTQCPYVCPPLAETCLSEMHAFEANGLAAFSEESAMQFISKFTDSTTALS